MSTPLTPEQIKALTPLLAKRFIQRRDPIAEQTWGGGYRPLRDENDVPLAKFDRTTIEAHLSGNKTYGHYMLDTDDNAKLMVFDIDLQKSGTVPTINLPLDPTDEQYQAWIDSFVDVPDLRALWHQNIKANLPARAYIKRQLRELGGIFAASINMVLEIDTAVAYTGNKGIHIYGFTGVLPAGDIRELAQGVIESIVWMTPLRGDSFFHDGRVGLGFDPSFYTNFHIELYPKQATLGGKSLGNLVRLPLGRNLHAPDNPTFFVDLASPLNELRKVDPVFALTTNDPWQTPEEASAHVDANT